MVSKLQKAERVTAKTARRITGISVPFGGISWADPGPSDAEIVRRFIVFLEDRRVLYNAYNLESLSEVERSIHEVRSECTETLQALGPKAFGVTPIRSIRAAGRRFHDDEKESFRFFDHRFGHHDGSPGFFAALGAFRSTVGQQVAVLAAHYDIDIEGDLASALPKIDIEES
jgi:hypothetical protein